MQYNTQESSVFFKIHFIRHSLTKYVDGFILI